MAAAAPWAPPDHLPGPRPGGTTISWDSEALCRHAECLEMESEVLLIDTTLLPTLEGLLLEMYAMLRPKPVDYEQRKIMVDVFNKLAKDIFGKGKGFPVKNGFPVVEAFGSFTMDLFTPKSDLDLSINFNADMNGEFDRKDKIFAIRKLANVLFSHQRRGLCYGVSPIVSAIVPVLKVTDKGTGVECDISVENKDGMSRSMIFKLVSSIDERFQILCYLMKFWAKAHDINCPRDRTMSSMAIISLVAFHLQLLSVESLWEQGLCASNFDGLWISKTWERGIGNLSVEDFLDRSQNFARSVGKVGMGKICEYLRLTVLNLTDFFGGKIDAPMLKILLFGALNLDEPINYITPRNAKRKINSRHDPENGQKRVKQQHIVLTDRASNTTTADLPPGQNLQKRVVKRIVKLTADTGLAANTTAVMAPPSREQQKGEAKHTADPVMASPSQKHQKGEAKHTADPGSAANATAAALPSPSKKVQKRVVKRIVKRVVKRVVKLTAGTGLAANPTSALPPPSQKHQKGEAKHTADPGPAANATAAALPPPSEKQQKEAVKHTADTVPTGNAAADVLPPPNEKHQKEVVKHTADPIPTGNTAGDVLPPPSKQQKRVVKRIAGPGLAAIVTANVLSIPSKKRKRVVKQTTVDSLPPTSPSKQQQKRVVKHTADAGPASGTTGAVVQSPAVFVPPRVHQPVPAQASTQFARHLFAPARFAYRPPPSYLHSAPHSSWALHGQPQGNLIHLNPGIQWQQQAQHMFVPPQVHRPMIDRFHPYGLYGAQQTQQTENRMMRWMPYGTNPNH